METLTLINCWVHIGFDGETVLSHATFKIHLHDRRWDSVPSKNRSLIRFAAAYKCVSHNSADEGSDMLEVIWEPVTDITKELNGLRQVSHTVSDTHRTVNGLWQTHTNATFCRYCTQSGSRIRGVWWNRGSDLVKTLPVGHFGVRQRHPAQ